MQVDYKKKFEKDISKIRLQSVSDDVLKNILAVKECQSLVDFINLPNVTKLVGYDNCYRIKLGDYRIGVEVVDDVIHFSRFGTRSKIYDIFP